MLLDADYLLYAFGPFSEARPVRSVYASPRLSDIDSVNPDVAAKATRIVFVSADETEHVTCVFGNEVLPQLFQALIETGHPGIVRLLGSAKG
jgi:hypothetical protein